MKRRLGITVLFTMIFSLFLIEASAQYSTSAQNSVIVGSTFNYKVDNNGGALNYTWSVIRNTGTGTLPSVADPNNNLTAITWNSPGTYTVSLETEMQTGGCIVTKTFDVTVVANNSTLVFDETSITDCASSGAKTTLSLGLKLDLGVAPWTVKYKIDDVVQTDASLANDETLTISHEFTNVPGGTPQIINIEITDALDAYGVRPSGVTFPIIKALTLNELPNTSEIQHD
jgi:hypothetical protein